MSYRTRSTNGYSSSLKKKAMEIEGILKFLDKKEAMEIEGILKFNDKKEAITIDEDLFPPVASINTTIFYLRALIESKKVGKLSIRKVWVPKYCLVRVDRLKKEWVAVCIDPPSRRNSMKG